MSKTINQLCKVLGISDETFRRYKRVFNGLVEKQKQVDWNENDTESVSYIKNKPIIQVPLILQSTMLDLDNGLTKSQKEQIRNALLNCIDVIVQVGNDCFFKIINGFDLNAAGPCCTYIDIQGNIKSIFL